MKKNYSEPFAEKVVFDYRNQVVAASGCIGQWVNYENKETGNPGCSPTTEYPWTKVWNDLANPNA